MSNLNESNSWISFTSDSRDYDDVTLFGDLSDDGRPKSEHNKEVMDEACRLYRAGVRLLEVQIEADIITKLDYKGK